VRVRHRTAARRHFRDGHAFAARRRGQIEPELRETVFKEADSHRGFAGDFVALVAQGHAKDVVLHIHAGLALVGVCECQAHTEGQTRREFSHGHLLYCTRGACFSLPKPFLEFETRTHHGLKGQRARSARLDKLKLIPQNPAEA
jgi:hypothetical protein